MVSHPAYPNLRRRVNAAVGSSLLLGAALAGCTIVSPAPSPNGAAQALADGLAKADLGAVAFDGTTAAAATSYVQTAVGDLKDVRRSVSVTKVAKTPGNDKKATADLTFTWDVSDSPKDWIYTTVADLSLAEDKTWHVVWSPALLAPSLTAFEKLAVARTQAKRADILGAGGAQLMTERDVFRIGIDKGRTTPQQLAPAATALAQLLGVDPASYVKEVTGAGPKAFVLALTLRVDDPLVLGQANASAVAAIPGGVRIPDKATLGPSTGFARALLGTVGQATAEVVQKSQGKVGPTDLVGLSGLEQRYDSRLRGTDGLKVLATGTDPAGKASSRELFSQEAVPGKPLTVSLDPGAQTAAEAVLAGTGVPTALVAIRPSTGEILAAANGPATKGSALATTGRAAPGSTFKIVTSLALLRAGITPDTPVSCTPTTVVDGRSFKNYADYPADRLGQIPLRSAVANSCNTAFISNSAKVSQADLAAAAAALGMGVDADLGFPAFLGSVPDRAASRTEHAASMIGQGKVEASPMVMAAVVASVIKGAVVRPVLITDAAGAGAGAPASPSAGPTASGGATTAPAPTAAPAPARPLQPGEAAALRDLLGAVVTQGSGQVLADVGATLAKTGTAEYGSATPPRTHAWMVAGRGDLAVAVYVEDGQSGSGTAGPLLRGFLQAVR